MATEPEEHAKSGEHHKHEHHLVIILVNNTPVKFHEKKASGAEIKTEAIAQGVQIDQDYILREELADGKSKIVEDSEEVHLYEQLRFHAVAPHEHEVIVSVNEQPVTLKGKHANGAEIKAAAISQGVLIQQNFVLQEELPNGTSRVVGDADKVHLREHLRFTAIAPDDNS
jgi:hypothetical protein